MSEEVLAKSTKEAKAAKEETDALRPLRGLRETPFFRIVGGVGKFALAVLLSQSLLLSFVVVGWMTRAMQRTTYRRWWKLSALKKSGVGFEEFIASIPELQQHARWPNFFFAKRFGRKSLAVGWRRFFASLLTNAKLGVQMIFNTWVLTLPGCVVMMFSWGYGWNNSFNKGYEMAPIGPGTGILGITLFITAMLYVPMAQAHQAATDNWRAFYQWRIVWRVVRHRWLACLLLAMTYSLVSLPIAALRIRPQGLAKEMSEAAASALSAAQVNQELALYFLRAGIVVIAGTLLVRWIAARIYAGGLIRAVRSNDVPVFALTETQHAALDKLGYLNTPPALPRHPVLDFAGRFTSLALRFAAGFAFVFVWFTFVAQVYVAQFLNYIPLVGWLNQPLVQLPWIKYLPTKVNAELIGFLIVSTIALVVIAVRSAIRQLKTK